MRVQPCTHTTMTKERVAESEMEYQHLKTPFRLECAGHPHSSVLASYTLAASNVRCAPLAIFDCSQMGGHGCSLLSSWGWSHSNMSLPSATAALVHTTEALCGSSALHRTLAGNPRRYGR